MSRIGRQPIHLPDGVRVEVAPNNVVTVTGPKGTLTLQVDPDITVEVADKTVRVLRPTEQKRHRAMHGLYRALIQNMVTGVTEGYRKELEIIGIGFRASMSGNMLELALGYSHPIYFVPPEGIKLSVRSERGSNPIVIVEGIDKQLVGEVAAKIRALRPPEPTRAKVSATWASTCGARRARRPAANLRPLLKSERPGGSAIFRQTCQADHDQRTQAQEGTAGARQAWPEEKKSAVRPSARVCACIGRTSTFTRR